MNTITEQNDDNVLEIRGLSVYNLSKNNKLLLDNINLNIKRGAFTALVGKSGLGKSITIKSVSGLLNNDLWRFEGDIDFYIREEENTDPDSSDSLLVRKTEILKNGIYNIQNIDNIRGKGIFTIFQSPDIHLNPSLKIGWQIGEMINSENPFISISGIEKRLTDVGLPPYFKDKYPFQLSQGEKQRVLLSMALGGADLVIADEPTSSLDLQTKTSIIKLFCDLRSQVKIKSLLLITHDIETIKGLLLPTDTIYVMDYNSSGKVSIVDKCLMEDILNANPDIHKILKPLNIEPLENIVSTDTGKPILQIENLVQNHRQGFFKKDKEILKGIDLNIYKGEIAGIVGESGCGKTTLIKSIIRLWDNTGGRVLLKSSETEDAVDLIKLQPDGLKPDNLHMRSIRRNLQVIFQNSSSIFNQKMMIYEILYETLQLTGLADKDKINRIIADKLVQFNICKKENEVVQILTKYPNELSGGEKQRLAILRVFLLEPEIIIADEPFAEQDVLTTHEIIEMLRTINKEGSTILLISHDLNIIRSICNKVYLLSDGKIAEYIIPEPVTCSDEHKAQLSDEADKEI